MASVKVPSEPMVSHPYVATARPIRPTVPSGARRMIHHRTFWMTASAEAFRARKGAAGLPTFRAAMPTAKKNAMKPNRYGRPGS